MKNPLLESIKDTKIKEIPKLTPDQRIAVDSIQNFLQDPHEMIFTLKGIGGAGKTFVTKYAIEGHTGVIGAAISHSARIVLQESLGNVVPCYTIAQLLGLKQTINEETGKIQFIVDPRSSKKVLPMDTARLILIDECSMIDEQTFQRILFRKEAHCKVLLLGDPFQLPPVDDAKKDSVTFNYTKAELVTSVRYTGPLSDHGTQAFYKERFPLQVEMIWEEHTEEYYSSFLVLEVGSSTCFSNSALRLAK